MFLISTSDNTQTKRTFSVQTFVRNAFADRAVGVFLLIEELDKLSMKIDFKDLSTKMNAMLGWRAVTLVPTIMTPHREWRYPADNGHQLS